MEADMLPRFIKYLEENKLVKLDILREDEEGFQNRFRIQKYVFLAKRFGMALPFEHNMYLYGPYSQSLAAEYYKLANNREELYDTVKSTLPSSFRGKDFLGLVHDKDVDWLEISTTLIDRNGRIAKEDKLIYNVENTKIGFTQKYISNVLGDVKKASLVTIRQ